jgi:hypothetical protein
MAYTELGSQRQLEKISTDRGQTWATLTDKERKDLRRGQFAFGSLYPYVFDGLANAATHYGKDKMQALIVILIGLSIILAGCGKRDVISGFPAIDKKEAVKWRPGAGTVIALGSVALLSVFAYIDSKSGLFERPAAMAEWCFCQRCALNRRQGVEEGFYVYLISEDGEAFDLRN